MAEGQQNCSEVYALMYSKLLACNSTAYNKLHRVWGAEISSKKCQQWTDTRLLMNLSFAIKPIFDKFKRGLVEFCIEIQILRTYFFIFYHIYLL
jgi:outer membrane receptor for Fe3+-dicitrate